MTSAAPSAVDVLETVDALGPPGTPVTTPEVAEGFDCTQRTIYNRLDTLVAEGPLRTKKVGANSRVWWRPVDAARHRNGGASGQRRPVTLRDGGASPLDADSEMAERIREFEWGDTPLGPMDDWPAELRVAVDIMLGAERAIGIYWGEDLTLLYNDLARDVIGEKHPDALGQPARTVFAEAWHKLGQPLERVLSGEGAARLDEFLLPLERTDEMEDTWWDTVYSPIPLEDGSVGGVFNIAVDVTDRKRRERNTAFLEALDAELTELTSPEEIVATAGERINDYLNVAVYNMSSIDEDADTVDHLYVWEDDTVRSVPDTVRLSEFSTDAFREAVRAGHPIVSSDTHEDGYTDARATETIDVRSFITVPFHREGDWEYLLSLTDTAPREWREDEVELVQELAKRLFPRLERARAEDALRESEQRYRRLFDSLNESIEAAFFVVEQVSGENEGPPDRGELAAYRFVETNPAFEEFTGLTDVVGKRVTDLGLDGDVPGSDVWDEVERTGESRRFEIEVTDGPLDAGWYDVRVFPYGRSDGGAVACLVDDITERKQLEDDLRTEKERLDVAVEHSPLVLFRLDTELRYTWIRNPDQDFEEVDVLGKRDDELLSPDAAETLRAPKLRALETGERVREEVTYELPSGQVTYDLTAAPIRDDSGEITGLLCSALDLTERKAAEERLEARAELDAFRVELTDAIRPLSDPEAIQREAARVLGEWLDVARAHYAEVDEDEETFRIHADHYRSDVSSTVGEHRLSDFGEYTAETLRAGDRLVLTDCDSTEQLSDEGEATFTTLDSYANVAVPLVKNDRLVAFFAVDNAKPREWTDTEIEMVDETAERTWAAVERAHAEQARRESEERFRAVANLVPSLLWSNDPEGSTFWYNQQWLDYTGQTMEEAADYGWLNAIHPEDREQSLENFQRAVDAGEPLRQEYRIQRHDGEYHWFLVQARPVRNDGEISRWFGAATDIHDQREMRATLERLNAVTRDLLDTESATIEDRIAGLVRDILDVEYAALWRYDDQRGDLEQHAVDTAPDVDPGSISVSTELSELVWQTFVGSDIEVATDLDGQDDTWGSLGSRVLVPLGRHGVVCLGSPRSGTFDEGTVDLVEMVAATVETAWDRAAGEAELADRNEELVRLDSLNTLIREINQALVAADTREEIDDAVCERLANSDRYEFAWIGEHDPGSDSIEPRAWAGVDGGYLEDLSITVADDPTTRDPIARAAQTGDLQTVADIATSSGFAPWREATLERGARSLVCIPLVYEDATYGVLTVYADRPQSDEDERNLDVLSELGATIAHALNARETRATLQTDSVVELTLRFEDADTPLCRLAGEAECSIEHQGIVPRSGGQADVFFVARGVSPAELRTVAARSLAVEEFDCLTGCADGSLFRARVSDPTLAARLTDEGAVVRSLVVDDGVATAVLDVPHTAAVREYLDRLRQWAPDFDLRARTSRERPLKTRQSFVAVLEDHLTDRQREVLQTAYLSGFFEMPRVSNGQEVTELLGVSQPTFSEDLRAAERRLCAVLFETDPRE
ncbi:GAF domain-containing protein [Salinirubrum litoreum]|uniref:histidine kinase n=1 Tax=Salinirubrum litoreum TaxID=1126234 RepID=A0ABD5RGG1_9EURY|nr:bacterio-opsin activator domain-containing protein [Salinirubrum litoreum]